MAMLFSGEAGTARDALCRTMYSRLFTLIVARINEAIKVLRMLKVSHFEQFLFWNFLSSKIVQHESLVLFRVGESLFNGLSFSLSLVVLSLLLLLLFLWQFSFLEQLLLHRLLIVIERQSRCSPLRSVCHPSLNTVLLVVIIIVIDCY